MINDNSGQSWGCGAILLQQPATKFVTTKCQETNARPESMDGRTDGAVIKQVVHWCSIGDRHGHGGDQSPMRTSNSLVAIKIRIKINCNYIIGGV